MSKTPVDNGIYYFIGNITNHVLHALPLYEQLGGTFVVASERAKKKLEAYDIPVVAIDNLPYKWMRPGRRPQRIHEYNVMDKRLKKTYDYLNSHAKVVVFYELFELERPDWLSRPKKVFLPHGNMLKSYMTMHPKRLEIIKDYDYMAALGPHMKQQFIKDGIAPEKLVDIGIARTDEVIKGKSKIIVDSTLAGKLGLDTTKPIVCYLPTFWGASSIYNTGFSIVNSMPEDYTLLFRPHPQTPEKLLKKYLTLIKESPNVIYTPEGRYEGLGLVEIFNMSSVIIGDVSSVMLEAILTEKPLIFAYDESSRKEQQKDYEAVSEVVNYSQSIESGEEIGPTLRTSLRNGIDKRSGVMP